MATCSSILNSSFLPCFHKPNKPHYRKNRTPFIVSCNFDKEEDKKIRINPLGLLSFSVTLTVISTSLARTANAAPKVSEKRRSGKKTEALTPEELNKWSQGLPVVSNRLPYTEILDLKRDGKLKHIVKPPSVGLKQKMPEVVLAVLEDSKVVRIVLPSVESDPRFWSEWDELKIDGLCMNAYTPPLKKPEFPLSYSGFVSKIPHWIMSFGKPGKPKPQSKKAMELKRVREELKRSQEQELVKIREERERVEKAAKMQKKMEERQRKRELNKMSYEEALRKAKRNSQNMAIKWNTLARDPNVATALGGVFFYIFYRTVVLGYKKQKKDYDDRLKLEQAEAEEREKMKQLDRQMGIDGVYDEEGEGPKKEENPNMKMAMQFMKSGARVRLRNKNLPPGVESGSDVKFSDVAGLGKIREELEEVVKFFTHGEIYRRRGVKIPGGVLLCGPPGVGKTLLAKAVAGEAGVTFFSISASQFVEIYVGVGASRVRALYKQARLSAPSVVFIDELDAVGRERGMIKGSGGQERDATLNQLLVCLDGFEGKGEVITIASTNRPGLLDPALVRPGRFDRKISIPKPGVIGRIEILQVHARKKPMAPDVDYMAVAAKTAGLVGAHLANIIEVAAVNMMRDGRTEITTDDLLQAAEVEDRGMQDRKERSPEMWKKVAINEAAMAVVGVNFPDLKNIEFVTIAPRAGRELGYVRMKLDEVKFANSMISRQSVLDHITVQLAPRAADEIWYGEHQFSTIWAMTANNARSAARSFVMRGLSEKHYGVSNHWVADRLNDIDSEALRILNMCYDRAKEILHRNRNLMDALIEMLIEKKSLSKEEFFNLVELHGSLEPMPPSIVDIRSAKCLESQDTLTNRNEVVSHGSN